MHSLLFLLAAVAPPNDVEKISEAIGHMIGEQLEQFGLEFDIDAVAKGLKEASEGKGSPMSDEECAKAIFSLQDRKISLTVEKQLEEADAFSNGNSLLDEDHPVSAPDSTKHR
jgi:peptidylprolyl isomerase